MDSQRELTFLDLSNRERQEWADLPVSRLLLRLLQEQQQVACDTALIHAAHGRYPASSYQAGYADALKTIVNACVEDRAPAEDSTQDTTFVHPSARRNRHGSVTVSE